ncbi:MAG: GAF domain-containing protein [Actinobacteria bacterium]|nr:GAF domain-containing protein [Actinomycetota bacterium]
MTPLSVPSKDHPAEDAARGAARHDQYRELLDVVADIAAVEDPVRLANQVAEQARRLIHADVTYLWLSAPQRDDAHLGATSGGMSAQLRDIRIPAKLAMAGRIIETGLPLVVSQYLDDDSFIHYAEMDRVMENERIIAAAGVPLVSGTRTIGALVAANRDSRSYSLADVELLRILASHAAIALERAAVADERSRQLAELRVENRELARRNAEASDLHNRFARVTLTGGQIDELVNEIRTIVGGEVAVFDEDGRMLAEAGGFAATNSVGDLVRAAANARSTQLDRQIAAVPVVTALGLHGVLCLCSAEELQHSDIQVIERGAVTAALLLLRAEAEARAAGFRRDDFVYDLVTGSDAPAHLMHRAAQLKVDLRSPYTIHLVRAELQDRRLAQVANEAARGRGGLAGHVQRPQPGEQSPLVVLLPGLDPRDNSMKLAEAIKRAAHVEVSVAGAGPLREVADVGRCFDEASACSEAMLRLGGYTLSGTLEELGFLGLVLGKDRDTRTFVDTMLAPVIDYDSEHQTDLLRTLDALLSTDGGPTAASQLLHVHVSTVKQRMQRLQRLLGEDWRSVDRSFELRLALKLHRINTPLG